MCVGHSDLVDVRSEIRELIHSRCKTSTPRSAHETLRARRSDGGSCRRAKPPGMIQSALCDLEIDTDRVHAGGQRHVAPHRLWRQDDMSRLTAEWNHPQNASRTWGVRGSHSAAEVITAKTSCALRCGACSLRGCMRAQTRNEHNCNDNDLLQFASRLRVAVEYGADHRSVEIRHKLW